MSTHSLALSLAGRNTEEAVVATIEACVIAGWTGRDAVALEKHIVELEALGVKRPASTPIFYRASKQRLLITDQIEALGNASSGEVEYVVLQYRGKLWVGVGSDHTDREVETYGVAVSKQMCDKPIAPVFWAFEDVADHWDKLVLRSFITIGGNRELYQEGTLDKMLAPKDLIQRYTGGGNLAEGTILFGGTFSAIGGIRSAPRFDFEIVDDVMGRKISHGYDILSLPIAG
ncbi:MAG: hypothetical protein JWP25_1340 [Bradyrhizobium sp.]|nr:hypothetical protein [Bradyrhizobium sp.]MEA2865455.1 hypothetical protein [Bradyrhizobium sp.]